MNAVLETVMYAMLSTVNTYLLINTPRVNYTVNLNWMVRS